ncbi:membrane-associated phospholipid phosphatase [Lactobacillus colini]|uniref:Membrane-associated phospholipid phosphatase n=1 Tax=Lactobacillus colini TaxID=1819254 RepID=A0ABS4MCB0_9LACO|nr:membrane-associated phospholipid phosphatase [Lactobacillus colini]
MDFRCFVDTIIAAIVLAVLIFNIRNSRLFNFYDHWLHHKLIRKNESCLWKIITFLNEPKLIVVWDLVLAFLLFTTKHYYLAIWVIATLAFSDAVGIILKKSIKRRRPINPNQKREGYSFPSGHVLSITVMSLIIWKIFGRQLGLGLFIFLLAAWLLVVVSRLNMRAHYPSDILGATTLGILCFTIAQQFLSLV